MNMFLDVVCCGKVGNPIGERLELNLTVKGRRAVSITIALVVALCFMPCACLTYLQGRVGRSHGRLTADARAERRHCVVTQCDSRCGARGCMPTARASQ